MTTPYKIPRESLTEEDRAFLEMAYTAFDKGDRVYGTSPEDTSHIEWFMGLVLASLERQDDAAVSVLEVGHDTDGFFISLVLPPDDESTSDQQLVQSTAE